MNPLYLHNEGYEEEVSVNTILGVVFPEQSEETRQARVLETGIPEKWEDIDLLVKHNYPNESTTLNEVFRANWYKGKLQSYLRGKSLDS